MLKEGESYINYTLIKSYNISKTQMGNMIEIIKFVYFLIIFLSLILATKNIDTFVDCTLHSDCPFDLCPFPLKPRCFFVGKPATGKCACG
uniref:Nodule-specific cysteine-rich peptide L48 n=1 Tax=Lens culinaris TaxID=3864 RepID=A0A7T8IGL0_LENCU|nr:nodule-specific cysteine-rich peptide L48 [Lens culinaris]